VRALSCWRPASARSAFALPLVTAGFTALGAVIGNSCHPSIIGLLAGAGLLIYKNWDKVAPRLAKFWQKLKTGGVSAWENIRGNLGQAHALHVTALGRRDSLAAID